MKKSSSPKVVTRASIQSKNQMLFEKVPAQRIRRKVYVFLLRHSALFREIKTFREVCYIKKYGNFNNDWYLTANPDVERDFGRGSRIERLFSHIRILRKYLRHPLRHYVKFGALEGRIPYPNFDGNQYCNNYPDVKSSFMNPYFHYLKYGKNEGREISIDTPLQGTIFEMLGEKLKYCPYCHKIGVQFPSLKENCRIAIHIHLTDLSLMHHIENQLKNIPVPFALFISKKQDYNDELIFSLTQPLPLLEKIKIESVQSSTDNIIALLTKFSTELKNYDYVCHIHTDKTLLALNETEVKASISALLKSENSISEILSLLDQNGKIVFPAPLNDNSSLWSSWENDFEFAKAFMENNGKSNLLKKFPAFIYPKTSMFWTTGKVVSELSQLNFDCLCSSPADSAKKDLPKDLLERLLLILLSNDPKFAYCISDDNMGKDDFFYEETQIDFSNDEKTYKNVKVLAYYLPQFHPTPENDKWHGKGFTEWTSVRSAFPLFFGHNQQRIPHDDIGYYLLDSPAILKKQADMMKKSGVDGLIFYHYWFTGKLILERPAQLLLENSDIDMPFCFCWANENWTKRWDGNTKETLLEQKYSVSDAKDFIHYLIPFFRDPRYIRIHNRPVLFIYLLCDFPDFPAYREVWREECNKADLPAPYLVATLIRGTTSPISYGMDAGLSRAIYHWMGGHVPDEKNNLFRYADMSGAVYDYWKTASYYMKEPATSEFPLFKDIIPQWDNTARYKERAILVHRSTPDKFAYWFRNLMEYSEKNLKEGEALAVINAWNEWAEGAYLEPDKKFGYAFLNTIGRVLHGKQSFVPKEILRYPSLHDDLFFFLSKEKKPLIIFDHAWGGGANSFRNMLKEKYLKENRCILCLTPAFGHLNATFTFQNLSRTYTFNNFSILHSVYFENVHEIILNSIVSFLDVYGEDASLSISGEKYHRLIDDIINLKIHLHATLRYMFHDFFLLCPHFTLFSSEGTYCNPGKNPAQCNNCITQIRPSGPWRFLSPDLNGNVWRTASAKLIKHLDEMRFFSENTIKITQQTFDLPHEKITLCPHAPLKTFTPQTFSAKPLTIGIIGTINQAKGADFIIKFADYLRIHSPQTKIVIIGQIEQEAALHKKNIVVHGKYDPTQLPDLLHRYKINIGFLPSLCPETFSYVTQELMMLDLPMVCFDLGAPADRIRNWNKGMIIPEISAAAAWATIQKLYNDWNSSK